MHKLSWQLLKNIFLSVLALAAGAGWLYVIYDEHRAKEPMEIVKKHFVFYPEYSHEAGAKDNAATRARRNAGKLPIRFH
jgi:hypothetical protein